MKIAGFQKLTLLDYPGKTACILFTQGCNFKCSYCQNSDLIQHKNDYMISEEEIYTYLTKRKNMLDGVVVSGGEPTIQKDLEMFIKKVKDMGFLVKLDTNGSNPSLIKKLIDNELVDYIAMDIKNTFNNYKKIIKVNGFIDNIKESIKIISNSKIEHEFRTTIIKNFHDMDSIMEICGYFNKKEKIYLQNFEQSECVLDKDLISFSKEELIDIQNKVKKKFSNVIVRGL